MKITHIWTTLNNENTQYIIIIKLPIYIYIYIYFRRTTQLSKEKKNDELDTLVETNKKKRKEHHLKRKIMTVDKNRFVSFFVFSKELKQKFEK